MHCNLGISWIYCSIFDNILAAWDIPTILELKAGNYKI